MKYKSNSPKEQIVLFPQSVCDYIEENHLARFVEIIVEQLNFKELDDKYKSFGQRAYNPRIMTAIIFYGYAIGLFSSRKLEDSCVNRLDFRFLTNNFFPSYKTISEFRKENLDFLKKKFSEILLIGMGMGAVSIGNIKISIDGTKIRANASSKKTKDLKHLKELKKKTEAEVGKLLSEAEQIDKQEDAEQGDSTKIRIPEKVMKKKSTIKSIQKTILALEEKIESDKNAAIEQKGKPLTNGETAKIENQKMNMTDHDAHFMKERQGCIKSNYNGQISVDEKNQLILANTVTTSASDQHQLQNMIEKSAENIGAKINVVKADSGYENKDNLRYLEETNQEHFIDSPRRSKVGSEKFKYNKVNFAYNEDTDSYMCPAGKLLPFDKIGKIHDETIKKYKCVCSGDCPFKNECCPKKVKVISRFDGDYLLEKNLEKMQDEKIREEYNVRKYTVEPVFGDLKFNRKFTHFLLRSIEKVKGEFSILCSSFNIRKLHKLFLLEA